MHEGCNEWLGVHPVELGRRERARILNLLVEGMELGREVALHLQHVVPATPRAGLLVPT